MIISAIVAMGINQVIGKNNQLMWKLPLEMKYFKETTMGHHIIMGRKTFEANHSKLLPGRTSIIITRNKNFKVPEGGFVVHSLDEALKLAESRGESEAFIIGGAEIYKEAFPIIQKLYLTEVDFLKGGDAYFPTMEYILWNLISEKHEPESENNPIAWTARVFTRK